MSKASGKAQAEKKVRRQKQFIAVGSVVLLAILGFEMTKVLSHGGREPPPPAPATTSSSVPGSAPPSSGWKLPDTDRIVVQRSADQLVSFGLFGTKDPFVQQLAATPSRPASPAEVVPAATATTKPTGTITTPTPSKPVAVGLTPVPSTTPAPSVPPSPSTTSPAPRTTPAPPATTTSPSSPTAPKTAPTQVLISTNGACETVAVKGTFPSGAAIFRVVSITRDGKSVELGVVGGSYDSGQATVTLKIGQKLTLVNTSDGTRYVIQLKSKCDVVAQPSRAAGGSAPTTTTQSAISPAPTTTTSPTVTTPIVPDSLDTTTTPTG
jgi:hypothetical protein